MASKFSELNDKVDQKIQQVMDKVSGKGGEDDEENQEYYEPRTDDQIVDGGKLVLSKEQVDEAEEDRGGPASTDTDKTDTATADR
jgi:hypothetical protein